MTREEAVKILRENKEANGKKESPYSVFDWIKAHDMAIRSLEAWGKVIKDATERTVTFIPESLEGNETYDSAFHDGVNYVVDIIKGYLKEVEE